MAEFAAAGSAVGVISLGLQVCSGLVKYFHAYKDYGKDAVTIIRRIESLSNLLEYLDSVLRHSSFDDSHGARLVDDQILSCSEEINELERIQKKWTGRADTSSTSFVAKQTQRVLYPLRKADLEALGVTLGHLEGSLKLSLSILHT